VIDGISKDPRSVMICFRMRSPVAEAVESFHLRREKKGIPDPAAECPDASKGFTGMLIDGFKEPAHLGESFRTGSHPKAYPFLEAGSHNLWNTRTPALYGT